MIWSHLLPGTSSPKVLNGIGAVLWSIACTVGLLVYAMVAMGTLGGICYGVKTGLMVLVGKVALGSAKSDWLKKPAAGGHELQVMSSLEEGRATNDTPRGAHG